MAVSVAFGVLCTWVVDIARWDALSTGAADIGVVALIVALAALWLALNVRQSDSSRRTLTQRMVICDEALGSESAVAWVFAHSVVAGLFRLAVAVWRSENKYW